LRIIKVAESRIFRWFLALTVLQAIHSAEEIVTRLFDRMPVVTGRIHEVFKFIPVINMTRPTFITLNILIVLFLSIICFFVYRRRKWALVVARIAALVEIVNGLLHISAAAYTGAYFPGAVSAVGLLVAGIMLFIAVRSQSNGRTASEVL
jgi:hypothetical protein